MFSSARAENYGKCAVCGLVITARCDAAQEKVPLFNYLPVVALKDWLERDGRMLLCDRAEKDALNQLRGALKAAEFSPSVLDTVKLEDIEGKLFPEESRDKKISSARKTWKDGMQKVHVVRKAASAAPGLESIKAVSDTFPQIRRNLLKELVTHKITGYYYLPTTAPGGEESGFVVLMREIRYIPSLLVSLIANGTGSAEVKAAEIAPYDYAACLDFSVEDFSCPTGQVDSPHIEHLMQAFSGLFARIGLPDPTKELHDELWDRVVAGGGK